MSEVLVIYLPAVNSDGKAGVDDFFAAGGTVAELEAMARPFEPVNIARERLSRDTKLCAAVDSLWATWREMPAVKTADCTDRAMMRALIEIAAERGKLTVTGVAVCPGVRAVALKARVGTGGALKALKRLATSGHVRRDKSRTGSEAARYTLLTPRG